MVLRRTFDEDAWTDRTFAALAEQQSLDPRERAFSQRLSYGTVQQAKRLDHVIGVVGKRPLRKIDPPVLNALRLGMYELLVLSQRTGEDGELLGSSSAHAAVDQAVEIVRGVMGERAVAFTNAVLRRAQVDGHRILAQLDPADDGDLATLLSMPEWLVTRVRASHGETGIEALRAQNEPHPGTTFRVNAHAVDPAGPELADAMRDVGVSFTTPTLDGAVVTPNAITVEGSTGALGPLIDAGTIVPQSLASQLVSATLDPQPGERVLDMCAAPGGKTTDIAARVGDTGYVAAIELHEHRADSIRALARRTGTTDIIEVIVADATTLDAADFGGGPFDRVLLDAPCTGTGVLGARPDARWKRTEEGVAELVALQRELLAVAARMVRPGGVVVYSTCSILADEDEQIADNAPSALIPDGAPRRTWPHEHGTEGFFIARFTRAEEES